MNDYTTLEAVWFILIAVLWLGYFILEGFDFGVGMLIRAVGRTRAERRMVLHSIGPVWDGNEVWLLVAGGATFAAFPEWYATLFSGFYLALFLILVGLIVRGVAFEFWGKEDSPRWRASWEWALIIGSFVPSLLWGVAWANIVKGVPIDANREFTGNLLNLLGPYALLGGVTTLLLFVSHGANFLMLRTTGVVEERARAIARKSTPAAALVTTAFLIWTIAGQGDRGGVEWLSVLLAIGAVASCAYAVVNAGRQPGRAFAGTSVTITALFIALFIDLFPNVMVSSTTSAFNITLHQAASTSYTLTVMTVVAVLLVPVVLLYQGWTYWVFRHRLTSADFETIPNPIDLITGKRPPGEESKPFDPGPAASGP